MPLVLSHFSFGENVGFEFSSVQACCSVIRSERRARSTRRWLSSSTFEEISPHSFAHNLSVDVYHVTVTNPMTIHYRSHFACVNRAHPVELTRRTRDLRAGEILENRFRHEFQWPLRVTFENKYAVL